MTYNLFKQPFAEDIIPIPYESDFSGSFVFETYIVEGQVGKEFRYPRITEPYFKTDLSNLVLTESQADRILNFIKHWQGSFVEFRLWVPWFGHVTKDFKVLKQFSDGSYIATRGEIIFDNNDNGQLFKKFQSVDKNGTVTSATYKTITKPNFNVFRFYDDGTEITSGWTLNTATGKVAYSPTGTVTWDGSFDIPVILDTDQVPKKVLINKSSDSSLASNFNYGENWYRIDTLPVKEQPKSPSVEPPEGYGNVSVPFSFSIDFGENENVTFENKQYETVNHRTYRQYRKEEKIEIDFQTPLILDQNDTADGESEADFLIAYFFCSRGRFQDIDNTDKRFDIDELVVEPVRRLEPKDDSVGFPYTLKFPNVTLLYNTNKNYGGFSYGNNLINRKINPIAKCVHITLNNGQEKGFSTHDRGFVIDGVYYEPQGVSISATNEKTDLSVNNANVESSIHFDGVTESEIVTGQYDNAEIIFFIVDVDNLPTSPLNGYVTMKGHIGEITTNELTYNFEILSKADSFLSRESTKRISPTCPYQFGDSDCGVDLSNHTYSASIDGSNTDKHTIAFQSDVNSTLQWGIITVLTGDNSNIKRYIRKQIDLKTVILFDPFPYKFNGGENVELISGCNKTPSDCRFYNNYSRFGGFPTEGNFMPGNDHIYNPGVNE